MIFYKNYIVVFGVMMLSLKPFFATAQYQDSVAYDTVEVAPPVVDSSTDNNNYDNDEEDYAEKKEGHIYDSSEKFFNWKLYNEQPFALIDSLSLRKIPDSVIANLKKDDAFWYVKETQDFENMYVRLKNDPAFRDSLMKAKGFKSPDEEQKAVQIKQQGNPAWLDNLIWIIIIIVFAGAVVYFLSANKISLFAKNDKKIGEDDDDENTDDIFSIKYPELIRKALAEKNYRLAVRLHYLQTLKEMSDKNLIKYLPEYTNQHYLMQLAPTKYSAEFAAATRDYEYVWYGKFDINESIYESVRKDFTNLQSKVKYA